MKWDLLKNNILKFESEYTPYEFNILFDIAKKLKIKLFASYIKYEENTYVPYRQLFVNGKLLKTRFPTNGAFVSKNELEIYKEFLGSAIKAEINL